MLPQTALFDSMTPTVNIPGQAQLSGYLTAALKVPSDPTNPDTPLFAAGFGVPYLFNDSFRVAYAIDAATNPDGADPTPTLPTGTPGFPLAAAPPTQTFRLALYTNDLRNGKWAPSSPTLLCGGKQDPTVFFDANTSIMEAFWLAQVSAGLITILDVNAAPTPNDPFAQIQG